MFYKIRLDLVTGRASSLGANNIISSNIDNNIAMLRYDGSNIVIAVDFNDFFIDANGVKHIVQHDNKWQEISCAFDDELINKSGSWQVKTTSDVLTDMQRKAKNLIEAARNTAITQPITSAALGPDHIYGCKPDHRQFLNDLITLGNGGRFTCIDSADVKARRMHTHAEFITLATDIETHISAQFDHYEIKLAEINGLPETATEADFDAITW